MPKSKLKLEKKEDKIIIEKNKNYEIFFSMSVVFYNNLLEIIRKEEGIKLQISPKFEILLNKIRLENEQIELNLDELKLFTDWIDCLCLIMLDLDNLDLKNKDIKKYLQLSESLIQLSKTII